MPQHHYVSKEEVQDVCRDIGVTDWTALGSGKIDQAEAEIVRKIVGGEALQIPPDDFKNGMEIELEHGTMFPDANVTNNHPILTGRIVLAHLKEGLDYYLRLQCMELEMELFKALLAKDLGNCTKIRLELAQCRVKLEASIARKLS